jgi:iron(III) transport system permease protein
MALALPAQAAARANGARALTERSVVGLVLVLIALFLTVFVALPLIIMLGKSFEDRHGAFAGLATYLEYFSTPALFNSIWNSLFVSITSAAVAVTLAFGYAMGLTRTLMPARGLFKSIALIPILAPSLLPGISLVYFFGNQGIARGLLFGETIYGPIGIILAEIFYVFPHVLIILLAALGSADARLYEASEALGAGFLRRFWTVTLPGARYGLVSAFFVGFTLVITDFGAPTVIGGQYNVLATDVYKQVFGQQNFAMGAVVGVVLLIPAILGFVVDRVVQNRQQATLTARSVPYAPKRKPAADLGATLFCAAVAVLLIAVVAMAGYASLVQYWPYKLNLTLAHYDFAQVDASGWSSYFNSIKLACWTAVFGTVIVFVGAYLVEKAPAMPVAKALVRLLAMIPLAVPGLVLGLSYIFFFNHPDNPLNFIYHTLAILVLCTIVHFYTVSHLTAATALKQLDAEFETVSASLKVPLFRTFWRVTVPICMPAILDIAIYFFVNAMTTVSALVFLYGPGNKPASVAVLNIDDAGEIAAAAAMAMMIVYTSAGVRVLHSLAENWLLRRTQAWRAR